MNIPDEFSYRVVKTRLSIMNNDFRKINEIVELWPGSQIDVIYENLRPIVVLVFESQEDALAFRLKYGDEYV